MNKHTISRLGFESQFADKLAGFITEKFDNFVMPHKFNADMITVTYHKSLSLLSRSFPTSKSLLL